MWKPLLVLAVACVGLSAQRLPPDLVSYLELTTEQVSAITRLNAASGTFSLEKNRRAAQVQTEISQETAKQTLDAMALGLRYLELEAIRREIKADQDKTVAEVQKVLTAPQKAKLTTLQDALRQYPTACSAVSYNLIPQPPIVFASFLLGPVPPVTGFISFGSVSNCNSYVPAIRRGDFTAEPRN